MDKILLVIGLIAGLSVIVIISRWWVDGLVSHAEFLALSVIFGGLAFGLFAVVSTGHFGSAILVFALILASVGWVLYCNQKQGLRSYYKEKIRDCERIIIADPRNTAARSELAESYYMIGDIDSAIAAMEVAVQSSNCAMKERYTLRQWQEERALHDSKTIVCGYCHSRNLYGAQSCNSCRAPLVYPPHAKKGSRKTAIGYVVMGLIGATFVVVAFFTMNATAAATVVGCAVTSMAGWMLLASSKGRPIKK